MAYDLINAITGVATAIGTVGATIVALWLGYRDSKPKLQVYATIGITMIIQLSGNSGQLNGFFLIEIS